MDCLKFQGEVGSITTQGSIYINPNMSYVVQPVSPEDAPGLARAMMTACYQSEHWSILFDSIPLEQIISDCAERIPWNLNTNRPVRRHLKVVDTTSGELVAYSRYILPESHAGTWLEAQISEPTAEERSLFEKKFADVTDDGKIRGMNYTISRERGDPMDAAEQDLLKDLGPCFVVDYMATYPSHQRRGISSLMLSEALKHADAAGLKSMVMAFPAGVKLYQNHGFQVARTLVLDDSKYGTTTPYVIVWLVREPAGRNIET